VRNDFEKILIDSLDRAGIAVQGLPLDKFNAFYQLLEKWQSSLNLTAIKGLQDIVDRHFCESLLLVEKIEKKNGKLLDFGSGNGFPALPIKIAIPELEIILVEARKKKCHFLNAIIRELDLTKIAVKNKGIKKLSELSGGERFDYYTMRGVGNAVQILAELPSILHSGGKAFIYSGHKSLPLLEKVAQKISAKKQDILLPGRRASYLSILELF